MKLIEKRISLALWHQHFKEIFEGAFQRQERLPSPLLFISSSFSSNIDFMAHYDRSLPCGLTYSIEGESYVLLLYLAVSPKLQSKGYGSQILTQIGKHYGKDIVLDIPTPDLITSKKADHKVKRLKFYQKNGFHETSYFIQHEGETYSILTTAPHFDVKRYRQTFSSLYFGVFTPNPLQRLPPFPSSCSSTS